ncbi:hypothetical protein Ancab_004774 [Ancistrocladus abbreviatus]
MGSDNQGVIQSSIALLQERFRQLQREKEMRERRETLRLFSSELEHNYQNSSTTTAVPMQYYEPPKFFFHPELVFPDTLPLSDQQFSLSFRPTSQTKNGDFPTKEAPFLHTMSCNKFAASAPDVDTSLHL